jgi:alkylhydroperoxidase family enzyme
LAAVVDDWRSAPIDARTRAALGLLDVLVPNPSDLDGATLIEVVDGQLDESALLSIGAISFHFNFMNRIADAFDFALHTPEQQAKVAKLLDRQARHAVGPAPDRGWLRAPDGRLRPPELERARELLLSAEGLTGRRLRLRIERAVRRARGVAGAEGSPLGEPLASYVDKLARHAYRIVDDDVAALRRAGHLDEAIFEVTIVGAFTAALIGVEQLLAAMVA